MQSSGIWARCAVDGSAVNSDPVEIGQEAKRLGFPLTVEMKVLGTSLVGVGAD